MNFNKFQKISISFLSVLLILIFGLFILAATREVQAQDQYDFYNPPSGDVSQPTGGYDFYNPPSGDVSQPTTNIDVTCSQYKYPWCQESAKNPAGLVARFYQIALGLAGAAALGVLIFGAILWTVSGAVTGKQDALEWIKGALWGLVLLLGAYLILWTINPDLVNLKDPAQLFKSIKTESAVPPAVAPATAAPATAPVASPVKIPNTGFGRNFFVKATACQGGITNCALLPEMTNKLNKLTEEAVKLGLDPGWWQVTEAYPPTTTHLSQCHNNGNCVDIALTPGKGGVTPKDVDILVSAATKAGFKVVNEYPNYGGKIFETTTGNNLHISL